MYKIIGADQKEYGPVSAEQLREWIREGRVNTQTQVRADDGADWKSLGSLPEFSLHFGMGPTPPSIGAPAGLFVPVQPQRTNAFAVTGLIMGLVSITFGLCCCYGIPFNVLGIIFSLIALGQIRQNPQIYTGKGMAIAGLVISILSFALVALLMVLGVALSWSDIKKF